VESRTGPEDVIAFGAALRSTNVLPGAAANEALRRAFASAASEDSCIGGAMNDPLRGIAASEVSTSECGGSQGVLTSRLLPEPIGSDSRLLLLPPREEAQLPPEDQLEFQKDMMCYVFFNKKILCLLRVELEVFKLINWLVL